MVGVAGFGWFRDVVQRPGYRFTVEHTVHVRQDHWRSGVGRALMGALIDEARTTGKHTMVAAVDAANDTSIRFHERLGFVAGGTHARSRRQIREVAGPRAAATAPRRPGRARPELSGAGARWGSAGNGAVSGERLARQASSATTRSDSRLVRRRGAIRRRDWRSRRRRAGARVTRPRPVADRGGARPRAPQFVLGAGERHIEETAFFGDGVGGDGVDDGHHAVLEPDDGHRRPLEPLGPVEGRQLHAVATGRAPSPPSPPATIQSRNSPTVASGKSRACSSASRAKATGRPASGVLPLRLPGWRGRPRQRPDAWRAMTSSTRALRRCRVFGARRSSARARRASADSLAPPPVRIRDPGPVEGAGDRVETGVGPGQDGQVRPRAAPAGGPGAASAPRAAASASSSSKACTTGLGPSGREARPGPASAPRTARGGGDDLGRGAVVVVETEHGRAGEEIGEPVEQGGVGAVPSVDGLAGVAHDEEVGARPRARPASSRHWAGLTSWNSSTKRCRMRHRAPAAAAPSVFEHAPRSCVTRSSRSRTFRVRFLVEIGGEEIARRQARTRLEPGVAPHGPRRRGVGVGRSRRTWAQWISPATAATVPVLAEPRGPIRAADEAGGVVDHRRTGVVPVGPVPAELGEGERVEGAGRDPVRSPRDG